MSEEDKQVEEKEQVEARARRMGWVPKDEFKGDPERWRDAPEFVERGEEMLGIANERNRMLDERLQKMEKLIKEFNEYHKKTEQRAYDRAKQEYEQKIKQFKKEQRQAVNEGDVRKFDELEEEMGKLQPPEPEEEVASEPDKKATQAFIDWHKENQWYTEPGFETPNGDKRMSKYALKMAEYIAEEQGLTADDPELYKAVTEEVKRKFPDKFENPMKNQQAVEGTPEGSRSTFGGKKRKKTKADLPPDARAAMERFVNEGLLTEEQYLKDYEWEED